MSSSKTQDCQSKACSLQTCLGKNTYSPEKCDNQLFALYECCQNLYTAQAKGTQVDLTSCPRQSVIQRWKKKHYTNS